MLLLVAFLGVLVSARWLARGRWLPRRQFMLRSLIVAAFAALGIAAAPPWSILTKCLGALAMPLGAIWLATMIVGSIAFWRGQRRATLAAAVLWLAISIAGNGPLSQALGRSVESPYADASPFEAGTFDAILVLGGGTESRARGGVEVAASGDRVVLAARLYHAGRAPILVTTGSPYPGLSTHDAARATERIWRELGVPRTAILRVDGALTTSDEARLDAELVRARGWRRVGLVTSASHMRRALARFEAEGLTPVPLAAVVRARAPEWQGFYSLIPQAPAAHGIHVAMWELAGRAAGR
ncbi:MAG: YdcF family protein [Sandaracinaceae bacterium]|nr:YdcF family protein [Sandaracinaceae bacterium]